MDDLLSISYFNDNEGMRSIERTVLSWSPVSTCVKLVVRKCNSPECSRGQSPKIPNIWFCSPFNLTVHSAQELLHTIMRKVQKDSGLNEDCACVTRVKLLAPVLPQASCYVMGLSIQSSLSATFWKMTKSTTELAPLLLESSMCVE